MSRHAQFTCFTSTKVQILTQKDAQSVLTGGDTMRIEPKDILLSPGINITPGISRVLTGWIDCPDLKKSKCLYLGTRFTCFIGAKVQILTQKALLCSVARRLFERHLPPENGRRRTRDPHPGAPSASVFVPLYSFHYSFNVTLVQRYKY